MRRDNAQQTYPDRGGTGGEVNRQKTIAMALNSRRLIEAIPHDRIKQDPFSRPRQVVEVVLRLHVGIQLKDVVSRKTLQPILVWLQCVSAFVSTMIRRPVLYNTLSRRLSIANTR